MESALLESAAASDAPPRGRRVYIAVNGCHENHMDAALLQRYLGETAALEPVDAVADADLILVQGCAVTQHMEDESRDMIAHLKEAKRPDARLIVMGCVAKVKPEFKTGDEDPRVPLAPIDGLLYQMDDNARRLAVNRLATNPPELDQFLGTRKATVFEGYAGVARRGLRRLAAGAFRGLFDLVQQYKTYFEKRLDTCSGKTFAIKICTGCSGECSYCSVRLARGSVKSKTLDGVRAEFQRGLDEGYRHIALIGTDIADYGKDIGFDLIDLLRPLVALPGDFHIRLRNLNPRWIITRREEFAEVLKTGKISYAQIALQSGNDRILGLMRRGYRVKDVMDAVAAIRRAYPPIVLRTQIIAGFPTETDEEFRESLAVVRTRLFDYADFFRYTRRPMTPAAAIGPEVPFPVIMKRYRKLLVEALVKRPWQKFSAIRRMHREGMTNA